MAEAKAIATGLEPVRGNRRAGLAIALAALAADQLSKWLVLGPLHLVQRTAETDGIPIASFFRFFYTENPGISMRFLPADKPLMRWLLVALTAAISAFVLAWMWREKKREDAVALALILGGALGNIADRVRLGYVVDSLDLHFGDFHPFLVFNVSDAAITIGVLLLLVRALLRGDGKPGRPSEALNG